MAKESELTEALSVVELLLAREELAKARDLLSWVQGHLFGGEAPTNRSLEPRAFYLRSQLALRLGDVLVAMSCASKALELASPLRDTDARVLGACALSALGEACRQLGLLPDAITYCRQSVDYFRQNHFEQLSNYGRALASYGSTLHDSGRLAEASAAFQAAIDLITTELPHFEGDPLGGADVLLRGLLFYLKSGRIDYGLLLFPIVQRLVGHAQKIDLVLPPMLLANLADVHIVLVENNIVMSEIDSSVSFSEMLKRISSGADWVRPVPRSENVQMARSCLRYANRMEPDSRLRAELLVLEARLEFAIENFLEGEQLLSETINLESDQFGVLKIRTVALEWLALCRIATGSFAEWLIPLSQVPSTKGLTPNTVSPGNRYRPPHFPSAPRPFARRWPPDAPATPIFRRCRYLGQRDKPLR